MVRVSVRVSVRLKVLLTRLKLDVVHAFDEWLAKRHYHAPRACMADMFVKAWRMVW